jgi:phosphopantetheine--protein transferase-like protein
VSGGSTEVGPSATGIGNDVVDLTRAEARGKAQDERFLKRVFTEREIALIRASNDPDRALWVLWAGKEAAFKVVQKRDASALFAHRRYEVRLDSDLNADRTRGTVVIDQARDTGECRLPVEWSISARRVHCVALGRPSQSGELCVGVEEVPTSRDAAAEDGPWTERELLSARSRESRAVRMLAKRLALEAGLGHIEVVRWPGERRFGPPVLYTVGASEPLIAWEPSLSHDGAFIAAALCRIEA